MLHFKRFKALALAVGCLLIALQAAAVRADEYPSRAIKLVVGFPPGGANDVLARLLAPRLSAALGGAPVVVDNRAGADGLIGTGFVAQANPDGYTLGLTGLSALVLSRFTYKEPPYNALTDFVGASTIASSPSLYAVNPALPVTSLADLVAYAKANPGKLNFATVGNGGISRMTFELLRLSLGLDIHYVTYKGAAQGLTDLLGGRLDGMVIDFPVLAPMAKQGRVRAIAINSTQRNPTLPDVPTVGDLGYPQLAQGNWYALVAPAKTPKEIITKLNAALRQIAASDDMRKVFADIGMEAQTQQTPEAFNQFLNDQIDRWGKVIKDAGIEPQ
jgi:tripartite-type tricarboxylate transporter receptor subunit TctC